MINRTLTALLALLAAVLAGCQSVPPTNVHQPMTARPTPRAENPYANGSIFNAGSARPLFEDRRARYVGDTLTISIVENTSASTSSSSSANRTSSISASVPTITGLPGRNFQGMGLSAETENDFAGKGAAAAKNVFTGAITVTVIEVLENGNLLVSGEKQVAIGHGQEYIRLSGVVNPSFIAADNTIASSRVADARVEYKESGYISEAQVMGWLARFFLSFLPF
ncbi:flagellar basal body L-ring protein FlgH [Azospira restricta]|uniref:Flagellar L-ring protein n=1 Tax=Azospira restricta TaxID=404405 RepID=A0A974SS43_9RHOO|nr:flagellar basal body L-ring protein FlgH [Azospira restricta]QRJ65456.1 flagellar basal body L-ring protein FlgH [Azospira restricta]